MPSLPPGKYKLSELKNSRIYFLISNLFLFSYS